MTSTQDSGVPQVEPEAIAGIRLKLARAHDQLEEVQKGMDAFWQRKAVFADGQFNSDSTEYTIYLRVVEAPPVEWAVIFGEAMHNLRSALDHTVYQLTIANSKKHLARTGFPIFKDQTGFDEKGRPQIRGVSKSVRTFIERLQPYHASEPEDTVLWSIQESWNQDKHRIIQLMTALSARSSLTLTPPIPSATQLLNGLKDDGAVLARVTFPSSPAPEVKVNYHGDFQIVDKNSRHPDRPAAVTYNQALEEIAQIIGHLLKLIV